MLIDYPPFSKPEKLHLGEFFNSDARCIRYGRMPAAGEEKAIALMMGGQTNYVEIFYESLRDLSQMGITTFYLERFGDGGSERQSIDDPYRPCDLPFDYYVRDTHDFVQEMICPEKGKPFAFLSHCLGGLAGIHYLKTYPNDFDFAVMNSPMFGSALESANTLSKEMSAMAFFAAQPSTAYISKNGPWSEEKLLASVQNSPYTHDRDRAMIDMEWQMVNPSLRLSGFTFGNARENLRAVFDILKPGALESITTPITIISPENDLVNRKERHHEFARRIPDCQIMDIPNARHNLWRESSNLRSRLFNIIAYKLSETKAVSFDALNTAPPAIAFTV